MFVTRPGRSAVCGVQPVQAKSLKLIMSAPVAIVVGASRGIGAAVAVTLASHGFRVVVAAKSKTAGGPLPGTLDDVVVTIQQLGGIALPKECDVRKEVQTNMWCVRVYVGGLGVL